MSAGVVGQVTQDRDCVFCLVQQIVSLERMRFIHANLLIVSFLVPNKSAERERNWRRKSLIQRNHETSYVLCPPGPWLARCVCRSIPRVHDDGGGHWRILVAANGTVYRFYVNAQDPTDRISAVFGNDQDHLTIYTPDGIFNSPQVTSWSASGINPAFLDFSLDGRRQLRDHWIGGASHVESAGAADPSLVEDAADGGLGERLFYNRRRQPECHDLDWGLLVRSEHCANGLPVDGRWLVAQVTTSGSISGQMNFQIFPLGVGADQVQTSITFDGVGTFSENGEIVEGCTDPEACNFNASAMEDDGSCDEGPPEGDCDCFGNELDALGICGGDCEEDLDMNGVCDDAEIVGCTNPTACNYDPTANVDSGDCQ